MGGYRSQADDLDPAIARRAGRRMTGSHHEVAGPWLARSRSTTQSADTSLVAERQQFSIWRGMSAAEKLQLMGELCESVRFFAEVGLHERHPEASAEEIRMRLFATWLDRDVMIRCYGWDPLER